MEDLEQLIVCGGCNAKIGPGDLGDLLADLPKVTNDKLLVGFENTDDAAVIKISEDQVIIQTLDFFPTMVSDPYLFGKIAAANALSDVYAMGGTVLSALNIVAFPEEKDFKILKEILRGGAEKVQEAGGILAGGHSIHDHSVKYGLSVTGVAHPAEVLMNNSGQVGDHLILTKPLGVGIITTGFSVGEISQKAFEEATNYMQLLNKYAMDVMKKYPINSCTDVTGFGLLGHLHEMLHGELSAEIDSQKLPFIEEAYQGAKEFILTAGGQRNRNYLSEFVSFERDDFGIEELLFDPQTSGGLLVSVPENIVNDLLKELREKDIFAEDFGKITKKTNHEIIVK